MGQRVGVDIVLAQSKGREIKGIELDSPDVHVFEKKIKKDKIHLTLGVYKLGEVEIPVKLFFNDNGKPMEAELPGFKLTVKENISKDGKLKPIKGVIGFFNYFWLLPLIILIAVIGYLIWQQKRNIPEEVKEVTPLQWAQNRLEEIKNENLPGQGMYKEYYDAISDCIRTYLKKKHGISAMESTLSELRGILKEKFMSGVFLEVKNLLEECDWIKFTPQGEMPRNIEGIWSRAYKLVSHEL